MEAESEFGKLEQALLRAGSLITYPPTPALALHVRDALAAESTSHGMRGLPRWSRFPRVAFVLVAALVAASALLLAFPNARDALAQLLGLRTVRIFFVTPTPTPALPIGTASPPRPTATLKPFMQCCETTLDDARARAKFAISLPPGEAPSRVYLQTLPDFGAAQQLILMFGDPSAPRFTLYEALNFVYGKGLAIYGKGVTEGTVLAETTVNGQRALWLSGAPHLLVYLDTSGTPVPGTERPVDANTLDWESGGVTLRLETKLGEQDAVRFAESLR
jgi:hypothetical protein